MCRHVPFDDVVCSRSCCIFWCVCVCDCNCIYIYIYIYMYVLIYFLYIHIICILYSIYMYLYMYLCACLISIQNMILHRLRYALLVKADLCKSHNICCNDDAQLPYLISWSSNPQGFEDVNSLPLPQAVYLSETALPPDSPDNTDLLTPRSGHTTMCNAAWTSKKGMQEPASSSTCEPTAATS